MTRLQKRLPVSEAIEVLRALDPARVRLSCVEGFILNDAGGYEARLDLIVSFDHMQQFSEQERIRIAEMFMSNRSTDRTYFEIWDW